MSDYSLPFSIFRRNRAFSNTFSIITKMKRKLLHEMIMESLTYYLNSLIDFILVHEIQNTVVKFGVPS